MTDARPASTSDPTPPNGAYLPQLGSGRIGEHWAALDEIDAGGRWRAARREADGDFDNEAHFDTVEAAQPDGKPFHGWSCDCDECLAYDDRGEPRPGERGAS